MVQVSKNENKRKKQKLQPRSIKVFTTLREKLTEKIYNTKDSEQLRGY